MDSEQNLYGQRHIWMPFLAALQAGRFAHAYLIYGPVGSGVMDVVCAMAKSILCPEVQGGFCNSCTVCRRIDHRSYCDLHFIEAEGMLIKLDQVRGVLDMAYQYPMEGQYRVFVVNSPEKMNGPTANMLLKVLEEPPNETRFLLGSENYAGILPTIISRCQGFRMRPLPEEEIQRQLQTECDLEPEQALIVARLANGSIGRAKAFANVDFQEKRRQAMSLLESLIQSQDKQLAVEAAKGLTREYSRQRDMLLAFIKICLGIVRDLSVLSVGGTEENLIHGDLADQLTTMASSKTSEQLSNHVNETLDLIRKIQGNLNVELILCNYFLKLASTNSARRPR